MKLDRFVWNKIVDAFEQGPKNGVLKIREMDSGGYSFKVKKGKQNENVKIHFAELIGEKRFQRICSRFNITDNTRFNKEVVHQLFLGMMDIQKKDMKEEEGSICERYQKLILFENFDQYQKAFLKDKPKLSSFKIDKVTSSGKGLRGILEKNTVLAHHHFTLIQDINEESHQYRDIEMLTSRLADREMEKGSVIHLQDGVFYVDRVFIGGGAYVAVLRGFNSELAPKIVCRGTALRSTATEGVKSGLNDLLFDIGNMGVKAIWPKLSKYLAAKEDDGIQLLGKSLGGAHAQELAILIEGKLGISVEKLITYCSVGVGKEVNELLKTKILANRTTPYQIHVLRNGVDYVPAVGGMHLGGGIDDELLEMKVTYISTDPNVPTFPLKASNIERIKLFARSFGVSHCTQTTLKKFFWKDIQSAEEIEKHLRVGTHLESIRKVFAWVIHVLTLCQLNGTSFKTYFSSK